MPKARRANGVTARRALLNSGRAKWRAARITESSPTTCGGAPGGAVATSRAAADASWTMRWAASYCAGLLVELARLDLEHRPRGLALERRLGHRGDGVDDRAALRGVHRALDALDGPADGVHDPADDACQLRLVGGLEQPFGELRLLRGGQRSLVELRLLAERAQQELVEELLLGLTGLALSHSASLAVATELGLALLLAPSEQPADELRGDRDQRPQRRQELLLLALALVFLLALRVAVFLLALAVAVLLLALAPLLLALA